MQKAIEVKNLTKVFTIRKSEESIFGTIRSLFSPTIITQNAIADLSFEIGTGEKVAFIGPNGAGKSTTIKILTGILYPTSGSTKVLGIEPATHRKALAFKIGTLFGQRSQLWFQLPASLSFSLLAKIYEIPEASFKKRLRELVEIFEIETLLQKPVKQLSLGERMRCELVASLLHKPEILFLDEPTIGLDLNAKLQIRNLLNRLAVEQKTTLFLTSHDMQDIEEITERVLVLDKGRLIKDSSIYDLRKSYMRKKNLTLVTEEEKIELRMKGVTMLEQKPFHFTCEVDLHQMPIDKVIQEALKVANVKDITIEDPSMEEIIRELYAAKV